VEKEQSPGYEALIYKPTKVSWAIHSIVSRKEGQLDRLFFYFLVFSILAFIAYGNLALKAIVIDTEGTLINSSNPQPVSSEFTIKVGKIFISDNKAVKKDDTIFTATGYMDDTDMATTLGRLNQYISLVSKNKKSNYSSLEEIEILNRTILFNGIKAEIDDQLSGEATRLQNLINRYLIAARANANLPSVTNNISYKMKSTEAKIREIELRKATQMLAIEYEELKSQLVEFQSALSERISAAHREIEASESELLVELNSLISRVQKRNKGMIFQAESDGIIRYSALSNSGQILMPGNVLYFLVQSESEFIAELKIQNRDISKISKDMEVKLDIEAFPASEYGVQPGRILEINQKVVKKEDNNNAREFVALVKLDNQFIQHGNTKITGLRNGMILKAKVVTKYEKMVTFMFKKLLKIKDEYLGS
jgi:multidrug resistance efflux pump